MNRTAAILIGLAGAAFSVPGSGRAAEDGYSAGFLTRGVDAAAYIDQGGAVVDPFYVPAKTGALLPRVSLSVRHDDNVFLDPTNGTTGTSIELVPGLLAIWGRPSGNHLYADYGMILPVYESETDLRDKPSHLLRLGSAYRTGKSQIQGQVGYRRLEDVDTVLGARVAKEDVYADLGGEYRITGKSSAGLQGRAEINEFDEEKYVDYARYYGAGRLYRRMTPKSQGFIQGGVGRDEPRRSSDSAAAADFYDLSVGVRGKQTPKFHSVGRVGYMWRTYDDEDRDDYSHWIASLRAESTPLGLTTWSAELLADVRPAVDSAATDVVDQGLVLGASRRLFTERLRGNASATFGRIDYSGADPEEGGRDGRTDRYWGFSLGADWWSKQRFSVGLAYSYMRRDGDVDGDREARDSASYEQGRWVFRASWNY